ncbi:MAG: aminoacyl-histidine dipeptidase [Bacteroidales bacterium]
MNSIKSLAPQLLWKNFYEISQIPHPSGHCEAIREHLVNFGKNLSLETLVDEAGNVLIRKAATKGLEALPIAVLQAHMDMVPQKNSNVNHKFETDPLNLIIDGEWVTAQDTTLGADNGIGLAACMAILESTDIPHGALEVLVTVDEETGMFGAFGLKEGFVKGKILINTDSEDEGELFVGCAGGVDVSASLKYRDEEVVPEGDVAVKISVTGLKGGHSGCDIHLGRGNANKILFNFLKQAVKDLEARLAWVRGGSLRNAIPREAFAIITLPAESLSDIMEFVEDYYDELAANYEGIEPNLKFTAEECELPKTVVPEEIQDNLINAVCAVRNGVGRMISHMPDVVETSSNMAIINVTEGEIDVKFLVRSSNESMKMELASSIESTFNLAGFSIELSGSYPGWQPNPSSKILETMKNVHIELYGKEPKINVIHAGLECGIIGAACPGMDMISFGPTLRFPHSPDEKVNIASVARFWDYLLATLKALN